LEPRAGRAERRSLISKEKKKRPRKKKKKKKKKRRHQVQLVEKDEREAK
jgi:hypothetical protein